MSGSTNFSFDINKAVADLGEALRDGAYVAIGLGILSFQRAQVRRVELTRQLEGWFDQYRVAGASAPGDCAPGDTAAIRSQLTSFARAVDERMQPVRQQFDEQFDLFEAQLPATARQLVHSVRAAAVEPEQRLRSAVGLD